MPQVAAAVASALIKIGVSKAIAAAIGSFVVQMAVTAAVTAVTRALQPKPKAMEQGVELQTRVDPAHPRAVAVGKFATGGTLVYENVSGAKNKYLWHVIAISDAQIEEITQVRGNGEALTFSGDIHTGLRECTSHFIDDDSAEKCLSIRIYKGTSSQTADPDLDAAFTEITSDFRGRGIAYAIVRRTYSPTAWQSGGEFVFVGKGALIEDTRTSTTVWTENAALITRAYTIGFENNGVRVVGLGCDDANDLPEADWEAAADECDEDVNLAAGGSEDRYRAGGMISARENAREVIAELTAAMGGVHVDVGGQVTVLPGVARTPVMDIAEEDLLADEGLVYVGRRTADERVNSISSTFVNPDDGWQEAPLPPRKDASAITADGARYETHRAYRFVNSKTQGQRLDEIELRRARYEGFLAFSAPLWAFELAPGDWFTMTSRRWGNVEKTWMVESIGLAITSGKAGGQAQARCSITAREIGAGVYDWETSDEITTAAAATTNPSGLPAIVNQDDRIITADGLPLGSLGGTGLARTVAYPLSASSSSQIDVAAHDVEYVGKTYELPSAALTGLTTDRNYWIFYVIADDDYDAHDESVDATTIRAKKIDADAYILVGQQRTQDGGGGYSPPPAVPPGSGGPSGGGGDPP
jgi:hypothetical protein